MIDEVVSVPTFNGTFRAHNVRLPKEANRVSGINILGRTIRSLICSTDIAIIRNCDADAVFAVYPFTPQQIISKMLVEASSIPVLVGVGGGRTNGSRSALLAKDAEAAGAYGVVLNAPVCNATIDMINRIVDIPIVVTMINADLEVVQSRLDAGASIINVAAGKNTPQVVEKIRAAFPDLPIIASGGPKPETILSTASAGANSIVCTPPSCHELFTELMEQYREADFDMKAIGDATSLTATQHEAIRSYLEELELDGIIL